MSTPTPKEIRDLYSDFRSEWQDVRDEAAADMQAISAQGPWTAEDRSAREDRGRPCLHLDQINQYLHQYTGNLRKNKRAIQVNPKGNGANEADAAKRQNMIRGIEDQSNAPTAVYIPAAESAAQRSYGFSVLRTEYKDLASFDQRIVIKPIANPDCVLISPYYKQPNACDITKAFLLEPISKKEFKRLYPKARAVDFTDDQAEVGVSDWIKENYVVRAEFWSIETKLRTLLLVEMPEGLTVVWEDELDERGTNGRFRKRREGIQVKREREVSFPHVLQYMTNGVELLDDPIPWAGSRIPIISCFGPERWVTKGGKAQRELLSLVRFAREPQMLFDFLSSQECEEAGMVPKSPFVGAKGQFESDWEAWEEVTSTPHAFLQYDPITDATGDITLPAPTRPQYQANFQQYELAKDSAGRSTQSAMGISPLPTAAQRSNQKSGIALEKIQDEEDAGTYQFVDNFENGYLHNMGWQINEILPEIYDTEQEMPITEPDGSRSTLHIVGKTSHPIAEDGSYEVQGDPNEDHLHTAKGDFDVTISSGPSFQSERTAQSDFVDKLVENIANLPQPGTPQAKVFALAIRMRPDLGPIGKEIADVFDPPPTGNLPPEAQAAIQQAQAQTVALQQENAALHADRAGRVLEQQNKITLEKIKGQNAITLKQWDYITRVVVAELAKGSKADQIAAQLAASKELTLLGFDHDQVDRAHDAAHEVAMAGISQRNAADLQAQQAAQAQAAQAAQPDQPAQSGA